MYSKTQFRTALHSVRGRARMHVRDGQAGELHRASHRGRAGAAAAAGYAWVNRGKVRLCYGAWGGGDREGHLYSFPALEHAKNRRWYSASVVDLVSFLRTTAIIHQQSKQRARRWQWVVGGMGQFHRRVFDWALDIGSPARGQDSHPDGPRWSPG